MKIIQLLEIYKNFSDEDIKDFTKYLDCRFFNTVKLLKTIFKEIIKNRELILSSEYDTLLKKLSAKIKCTDGIISKHFSFLSKATLDYFKIKSFLKNNDYSETLLNEYLYRKKEFTILNKRSEKNISKLNDGKQYEEDDFFHSYRNKVILFNSSLQSLKIRNKRNHSLYYNILKEANDDISLYSIIQLTGIYVNNFFFDVNSGFKRNIDFPINLKEKFKEYSENSFLRGNERKRKIFNIYYYLFKTINSRENKNYYLEYKEIINKSLPLLSDKLIKFHFDVLINYCIAKDRLGEEKEFFKKESLELMYEYYNNNYFQVDDEYIKTLEFSNFVGRAYAVGDFNILKSFIEKNSSKLNPKDFNDMVNYGLAYYYFGMNDYKKVLKHINDITLNNFQYRFDMRNIEIRVYYELDKLKLLDDVIHNYRTIILEDEVLTKYDKESLLKMLSYFNKLILLKNETNSEKRKNEAIFLINLIEKEPIFSLKKWLLKKFNEFSISNEKKMKFTSN